MAPLKISFKKICRKSSEVSGPPCSFICQKAKAYDPSTSLKAELQIEFPGAWPEGAVASVNSISQGIKN